MNDAVAHDNYDESLFYHSFRSIDSSYFFQDCEISRKLKKLLREKRIEKFSVISSSVNLFQMFLKKRMREIDKLKSLLSCKKRELTV